jgi:hypothetical protein
VNKKTEKELLCELKQATKAMNASRVRLKLALRCGSQAEIEEAHSQLQEQLRKGLNQLGAYAKV